MTNILALDASTELCSVALLQGDKLLEKISDKPRSHANCLLPMVDEVLAEAGCRLNQLDAIAFGAGPGSFTGLRICLGVVQGLAFGAGLPVVSVSSLEAMAFAAGQRYPQLPYVVPAIDARMSEVYWAAYAVSGAVSDNRPEAIIAPQVTAISAVDGELSAWLDKKSTVGVGSGWTLLPQSRALLHQCEEKTWPQATAVATLAESAFKAGEYTDAMTAEPVYLRTEITWKKRERIRGRL